MNNPSKTNQSNIYEIGFYEKMREKENPSLKRRAVGINLFSSGLAAVIGDSLTFPLDVVKVRLQIQVEKSSKTATQTTATRYIGVANTLKTIYKEEGFRSLYGGLNAGLQRQACFSSIRLGFYPSVRDAYARFFRVEEGMGIFAVRILAGTTTGIMSVMFAQPTEVIKIRMQADKNRYSGCWEAYKSLARKEGPRGMWKGSIPNMMRTVVINCCEIVTYDVFKTFLLNNSLMSDNIFCHFSAAFGAGMVATIIASPIDVVKTRYMNSPPNTYKSTVHCTVQLFKENGVRAFYKGVTPSFIRLVSWNVITFVLIEQLRKGITVALDANGH